MNKAVKTILIIAAIVLPVGVVITLLGTFFGGGSGWGLDLSNGTVSTSTAIERKSVDLEKFDTLDLKASSVDVIIMRGDSYRLEYVTREGKEPEVTQKDGVLSISQPPMGFVMFDFSFGSENNTYTVYVPEDAGAIDVELVASSGDITIDRVDASGVISVSSGDIVLNDVKGDSIDVSTNSGDISIDKGEYSKADFKATSGDLNLLRVMSDEINCKTSSGDIDVNDSEAGALTCDATSGEITVQLNGDPEAYSYEAHVSSGDITVNGIETDGKEFKKDAAGDKTINAHTSSGDINITVR